MSHSCWSSALLHTHPPVLERGTAAAGTRGDEIPSPAPAFPSPASGSWRAQSCFSSPAHSPRLSVSLQGPSHRQSFALLQGCPDEFIIFSPKFVIFPSLVLLSRSTWEGGFSLSTEAVSFLSSCFPKSVIQTTLIVYYFLSELPPRIIYLLLVWLEGVQSYLSAPARLTISYLLMPSALHYVGALLES